MEDHQKAMQQIQVRGRFNYAELKHLFYLMVNGNQRFSDAMFEIVQKLTWDHKKKLSNEYYLVLQELFYSAIDMHLVHTSDQVLSILLRAFPKSGRVQRMRGMLLESCGNDEDALVVYEKMLQDNLLDQGSRKRKIALLRKKGEVDQAIQALNAYLISFGQDNEAWLELADLYLEGLMYNRALFCYEELLLLTPNDQHVIVRVAELQYTLGGPQGLELAKNYFCYVLSKNANNFRGLWGLLQVLKRLVHNKGEKTKEAFELVDVTIKTIQKAYKKVGQESLIANYPFAKILSEFQL